MRKCLAMITLIVLITCMGAISSSADRSFTIDQVTIDATIDEEGVMHVNELYTYTFDGMYQGVTRSIGSDVQKFKAYLVSDHHETHSKLPENAEPLTVEKENNTYKIFSDSKNERKHILYQYEVRGSVNKYLDTAEITYDFFDQSNESDINRLMITFTTPDQMISNKTHAFLRTDAGKLSMTDHNIQYTNELLKAGEHTRVRLIFPAEELSGMELTKNKKMYDKILTEENDYIYKLEHLNQKMNDLMPIIWLLIIFLMIAVIFVFIIHPNRYRGDKNIDQLLNLLEQTDPLLIS